MLTVFTLLQWTDVYIEHLKTLVRQNVVDIWPK